jgi:hypothetical protein
VSGKLIGIFKQIEDNRLDLSKLHELNGCQTAIAEKIIAKQADYVLVVKNNCLKI